ncbi:MAG: GHMP kinase [Nitrososphaerota archaeon]
MRIRVKTPSRLHLGLLDLSGDLGRLYGGMGVAVAMPFTEIMFEPSDRLRIVGCVDNYLAEVVETLEKTYEFRASARIRLESSIPAHVGLGSRTQMALAVAVGLARLNGLERTVEELAATLGRGTISGVGVAAFKHGGFILEGGRKIERPAAIPPILIHRPFPTNWSFTIVIPKTARGPTDQEERTLFTRLAKMDVEKAGRISRLVLMKLLPAMVEEDITTFGEALTEIQMNLGEYFSQVQGGIYANPMADKILDKLTSLGAVGVGQSSWGPSLYGMYHGLERAERAAREVAAILGDGWLTVATPPNNHGAEISVTP